MENLFLTKCYKNFNKEFDVLKTWKLGTQKILNEPNYTWFNKLKRILITAKDGEHLNMIQAWDEETPLGLERKFYWVAK